MTGNIIEYLLQCVEEKPDKRALAVRDRFVTFQELNERAKQYGSAIQTICKTVKRPVGVFCPRDIEPVIAFLGVVYSGNFYVPLDPDAPTEKLKDIISDSGMEIIIGLDEQAKLVDDIGFGGAFITPMVASESTACILREWNEEDQDQPLYMIYTSGSTGKPKGVLKGHKAEIAFIEAYCETFDFAEDDVIGNQTPFYFDAAAKDIYLMLKKGITLEIIPSELFPLPTELIMYLNQKRITFASWVPTVLSIVAQLNPFSYVLPETLRRVFFVGEVMPVKHLNTWRKALPNIQYINLYGQSELCGVCSYFEVTGDLEDSSILPMGKPLNNCEIYLVADDRVLTEPGQIGEMYIVSDALAMEYYNDPEKTQRCFIEKDFGQGKVRCFKTGDLAQYDSDGNLVFASRTDLQIKHMGHRIELGEIEAVAGALPEVARCCCLYNAEKRKIVLFCELSHDCTLQGTALRSMLKSKLSAYMVPGKVIILEKLPLNANGKIDRQKLKTML